MTNYLNCIALDDEPAALEVIEQLCSRIPFVKLQKGFDSPAEALSYIHQESIDLIFLDIQMPDMMGTDFVKLIQNKAIQVIFTTAYSDYAIEGFNLNVLDYLLKPIEFGRFMVACNRAFERLNKGNTDEKSIFVKDGYDWMKVNLNDVLYIQSDTNLLFIHEKNRKITTRMTLADMLSLLSPNQFIRVHKSYIVAVDAIQKIEKHQISVGNLKIPLAESYRESIENRVLKK
jgi:two-component system, LytTR family, response regulator